MKQIFKITAFLLVILFFATSLNAQTEHRYTINPVFSIEKEILPVLTTGADVEANYCNAANSKDFSIKPFIQYSPINYLVLGAEYRVKYEVEDGESAWQGRLGLAAKGKYAFGNLKLDCRLKYTLYTDDYDEDTKDQYFRTRFQAQYKIKPIKLTPYVSYEWFYNIPRSLVDRDRWTFGVEKKLSKRSSLGFEYQLEEHFNRTNAKRTKLKNDIAEHVFSIAYTFEL